jgi:AraC family transcriptional regulator
MARSRSTSASTTEAAAPRIDYAERLRRVTDYIHDHLDDELDLNRLADIACLSPHHWHRIWHAMHGETVAATVKRLRLHRAAGYIAHTGWPMHEVARRSGYDNLQSFTRIFKSVYGMPPARYRAQGSHAAFRVAVADGSAAPHEVTVDEQAPLRAVGLAHRGPYMEIGRAFETLYGRLAARGLLQPPFRSIGLYHDDPFSVEPRELRSCACVVSPRLQAQADVDIAGGPHAVLRFRGPYATMHEAYRWLFGTWLVRSGRAAADAPVIEEYLNDPRTTPPHALLTEIRLPLAPG